MLQNYNTLFEGTLSKCKSTFFWQLVRRRRARWGSSTDVWLSIERPERLWEQVTTTILVSSGQNRKGKISKRFTTERYLRLKDSKRILSIHAEISALSKVPRHLRKRVFLVVVRLGASGDLKFSKPCSSCTRAITKEKMQVYYSTDS